MLRRPLLRLLVGFLSCFALTSYSQSNPITAAPPAAGYPRHETDNQNQIQLTLNAATPVFSCSGAGCAAWTVTLNGVPATISSVTVSGTIVLINFSPAVAVGQTVQVSYSGADAANINPFGPIQSYNDRPIVCADFAFEAKIGNTPPCAPVKPIDQMVFSVKRAARNSQRWAVTTKQIRVFWINNGAAPFSDLNAFESNSVGVPTPNQYFITVDAIPDTYQYPTNDIVCGYSSTWRIKLTVGATITVCDPTSPNQTIVYASHNTDAQGEGTGQLNLPPTIVNTNLVCLGDNVNMTFSDNTQLNCNAPPPPLPLPPNEEVRWVRVIYGSQDLGGGNGPTNNIPNIIVGGGAGIPVTDASGNLLFPGGYFPVAPMTTTFGNPDFNGVVEITRPVNGPRGILELIRTTSPVGQAVGQRFWVRLEYWNICNPYTGDPTVNVRTVENFIEIIDKPLPPVVPNRDVCSDESRQLAVVPALPAHTYRWYATLANALANTAVLATGATFTPSVAQAPVGATTSFFVTATLGNGCVSEPTQVTLKRRSALSNAGLTINGPGNLCPESSYVFQVNVPPAAGAPAGEPTRYRWVVPPGWTITPADGIAQIVTITTGAATGGGTVTVNYEYSNLTSNNTRCGVTITRTLDVRARPTANITPDPIDICEGTALQLNGNPVLPPAAGGFNPVIASHVWGGNTGILDAINVQQPNLLTTAPAGAYNVTYTVVADFGAGVSCASVPVNRNINISANPGIASTGPTQLLCGPLVSNPLGGNTPTFPATGQWSLVSRPLLSAATDANFTNQADPNTIFNGDVNGVYVLRWTITNNACVSSSDIIVDFGSPPPAATITASPDVCGTTVALTGSDPTFATGTWSVLAGPGTATFTPNVNDRNATLTVTQSGTYTIRWLLQSGSCPVVTASTDITFREPATINGPADFITCIDNPPALTFPVAGTFGGGASQARWEVVTGGGTFASSGGAVGAFSALLPVNDVYTPGGADFTNGSVQLRIITDDPAGACPAVSTTVNVNFDRLPSIVAAGPDAATCDASINLAGSAPNNGGSGSWSAGNVLYYESFPASDNGLGLTGPAAGVFNHPGSNWNITVPPASLLIADDWFRVQNRYMEARNVKNEVVWRSSVIPIAAFPVVTASIELAAFGVLEPDDYIRAFYRINGGAEVLLGQIEGNNVVEGNGGFRQLSLSGLSGNTIEIIVRIRNNDSGEYHRFDNVLITGASTAMPTIAAVNNPASNVTNLPVGVTQFVWTVSSALGFCPSASDVVDITRHPQPQANAIVPNNLCENVVGSGLAPAVNLTQYNNAITGNCASCTVEWFTGPGTTNPIAAPTSFNITNGAVLVVRVTDTGLTPNCQNVNNITFPVNPIPISINQFPDFCEDVAGSGQATNINLRNFDNALKNNIAANTVTWFTSAMVAVPDPTNVIGISGTRFIGVITDAGGCSSQAELNVTVNPIPVPNPISGADQVCVDPNTIGLYQVTNINAGSTYTWSIPEPPFVRFGGGGTNDFFVLLAFPTATSPGLNISVIETSSKGCVGAPNVKTITVDDNPPVLSISGPTAVCENETLINFSVPDLAGTTYLWTVPPGASVINGQGTSAVVVNFGALPGLVEVIPTSSTGCAGSPSALTVSINARPSLDLLSGNVCSDTPGNIILSGPGANTFNLTSVLVPPGLDPPVRPLATGAPADVLQNDVFTNLTGGNLTVQYTVVPVSADNCAGDPRLVNLVVRPEPLLVPNLVDEICSRTEDVSIVLAVATGSTPASAFQITSINNGGLTQTAGTDVLPGPFTSSVLLDDRWENLTSAAVEVQYFVRPVSTTGCVGDPAVPVRVIVNPEPILAPITPNPDVICSGDTPTVTFASNIPGSTFSWLPTAISGIISGATPGSGANISNVLTNGASVQGSVTYQVTPSGPALLGGCPGIADNLIVQINPSPVASNQNLIVCSDGVGGNTISTNLTLNQPAINNGAVTFSWFQDAALTIPIATPASFTMTNNVPVFVQVSDALCTNVATVLYRVNPTPSVTSAITSNFNGFQISCTDANDGQITATPANGTFPYQFSIDGGTTFFNTPIFNGLGVANNPYIITVRDANGCSNTAPPLTLTQPTPVTGIVDIKTPYNGQNVSCQNASDGTIEIIPSGGAGVVTANYTYRLLEVPGNTTGNNNGIYINLRAGQYTAVITDPNNCQFTIPGIILTEPSPVLATAVLTSPVTCAGQSDGVITVTGSGGTLVNPNYTFTLNQPPGTVNTTGVFGTLTAGSYTATVRDDNGCERVSNTIVVIEPSVLTAFVSITSNYSGANISCPGANDAQVTAVANGGNLGGYTFELIQSGSIINAPGTATYSNLGPGVYTVRVIDTGGCQVTSAPVTVVEPLPIAPAGVVSGAISCNGGSDGRITISATGGTGFYSFTQLPLPGITNISGIFTGLADGTYDFRVTDLNNCFNDIQVTIAEPSPIVASAAVTSNYNGAQISCNGASDGIITVTAGGGTGLLRYVFENILTNTTGQFSGVFTGVPASTNYTFRVRDAKNCEVTTAPIDLVQPDPVTGSGLVVSDYNGEDISCFGALDGEIAITGSGGTGAYTFRIDQLPLNTTGNVSGLYTGIGQGVYTATIRDANSCFVVTAPITVTSPTAVTVSLAVTSNYNGRQISCNGAGDGELTVTANGGVPAYSFSLVGFTGNVPSNVFNNLGANTYTVLVTDANGCTRLSAPVTITEPPLLVATAAITSNYNGVNVSCFGSADGSIAVTQTGGTAGFTYELLGGGPPQAGGIFNNLSANIPYVFRVTDVNSCVAETGPLTLTEPPALVSQATVTSNYNGSQISCNGVADGIITITSSGGTGIPVNVFDQFAVANQTGRFSGVFTSIPAGNAYTFTVTDVNGCSVVTAPVNVIQPDAISGTGSATSFFNGFNVSCFNATDGELTVTANGGTGDLTYLLLENPGNTSGAASGIFTSLRAGNYRVRIADVNGCLFTTAPATLTQPNDLSITIAKTSNYNGFDLSCFESNDGIVSVIAASGGAGGYTFEIFREGLATGNTSGQTNGVFTGLISGLYDINITDINNCVKKSLPVVLIDPLPLFEGILGLDQAICFNQDTPKPIAEISPAFGSIGNYTYQWQSSTDGINFSNVAGATNITFNPPANLTEKTFYRRLITSGCANGISNAVSVTINSIPTASLTPSRSPVCEGDFFILTFEFQNGQAPYFFDYNDGTTFVANRIGADITPIPVVNYTDTKTYSLTALRDFNGCKATVLPSPVTVPVSRINPNFTIISPDAQCSGGTFEFQWTVDPNVEYTWFWNDGQSDVVAANSRPNGSNTITHNFFSFNTSGNTNIPVILSAINNVDGCGPKQATRPVTIYPNILINLFPDKNQICSGEQITVVNPTQGGTSHNWQVVRQSDNSVIDARNFNAATNQVFTLNNNLPTAVNPDIFNIVYTVSNANCSDQRIIPITVFEHIIAGFNVSAFPVYTGAPVPVTFTNTSVPVNVSRFTYDWEYGNASNPSTTSGAGPFTVNYSAPGFKTIRLTAVNNAAQAAGLTCRSIVEQTILIQVPPFEARFEYIPVSACFPAKIEVTENFAVAGTNPSWRLVDDTGRVVGTSNADKPVFDIINPGIYTIFLEVINPITGQVALADNTGTGPNAMPGKAPIPIYPKPQSVFQARPPTVYVPNTELVVINFSQPTNVPSDEVAFLWNFGDSNDVIKQILGQPNPTHFYKEKGLYTITMIMQETRSGLVCSDTSAVEIEALQGGQISIPNAFTPDLTGPNGGIPREGTVNDVFLPLMKGIDFDTPGSFFMQIYDRWGNLLFESKNTSASEPLRGWDGYDKNGQLLPAGVYVYKIALKFSDGQRTTKVGDVTLIR